MKVLHYTDSLSNDVVMQGAKATRVRIPIGVGDGAPTFSMRIFTLAPGGQTPYHRHDYEHEIFVLEGAGVLRRPDGETPVGRGTVILVSPGEWHGFIADVRTGMEMICLVPNRVYNGKINVETAPDEGPTSCLC